VAFLYFILIFSSDVKVTVTLKKLKKNSITSATLEDLTLFDKQKVLYSCLFLSSND